VADFVPKCDRARSDTFTQRGRIRSRSAVSASTQFSVIRPSLCPVRTRRNCVGFDVER
jgi:hypothetical protein